MRTSFHIKLGEGSNPFAQNTTRPWRSKLADFVTLVAKVMVGGKIPGSSVPEIRGGISRSVGTVTFSAVDNADAFSINGVASTAGQYHSTGTVTLTSIAADATVTVNGVVFTAKAVPVGEVQFDQSGSDTADAASLVTKINACTNVLVSGVVTATSAAGVVTIRAVASGTGGNAITLAASTEAVSAATLTGGAAYTDDTFDYGLSNIETAVSGCRSVNVSPTALIYGHVRMTNIKGTVTAASVTKNDTVTIDGVTFLALPDGATKGSMVEFSIGASDNACATNLTAAINNHPYLREHYHAVAASAIVTVWQLDHSDTPVSTEVKAYSSSNGTRLAVVANALTAVGLVYSLDAGIYANRITLASSDGTDLAVSGARLTGGTELSFTL